MPLRLRSECRLGDKCGLVLCIRTTPKTGDKYMEGVLLFGEFSRQDLTQYWVKMAGGAERTINAIVFAFLLYQDMAVYSYFNQFIGVHILSKYDAAVFEKAIETAYYNKTTEGEEEDEEEGSNDGVFCNDDEEEGSMGSNDGVFYNDDEDDEEEGSNYGVFYEEEDEDELVEP